MDHPDFYFYQAWKIPLFLEGLTILINDVCGLVKYLMVLFEPVFLFCVINKINRPGWAPT